MVTLLVESWMWYAIVTAIILARMISRYLHLRAVKNLQIDDWLMLFAFGFYTTEIVSMNIVSTAKTNLLEPGKNTFTKQEISNRQYGSKMVLVVEQCQIATIWLVKACLLIMYYRITATSFRAQNIAIKILAGYVAFTFLFMEIFYFGVWCRPFHNYWAVPTPNLQCSTAINHLITNAVFNLSSDVAMLCIALPMFVLSKLPLKRKLVLCSVFGIGIFVIVAAALNKYYSFTQSFGSEWENWYIRECSTALLVANLPFTWTLLRKTFGIKAFSNEDGSVLPRASISALSRVGVRVKVLGRRNTDYHRSGSFPTPPERAAVRAGDPTSSLGCLNLTTSISAVSHPLASSTSDISRMKAPDWTDPFHDLDESYDFPQTFGHTPLANPDKHAIQNEPG